MNSGEWASLNGCPTALYRLYDACDELLYIGIARDIQVRFRAHADDKAWWPEVAWHAVEWHGTRREASKAENAAIHRERPKYNIVDLVASEATLKLGGRSASPAIMACPRCGVAPGRICRTRRTNRPTATHAQRRALMLRAVTEPQRASR